ncbi:hypothetical protein [Paenibacillus sp. S150]|uniref:hypothetical protein n=1 Tax=Paenibacillus sp. S150 TaxID=2749826 RepID=UPI001C584D4A|nr:hypothetical protein [Paenibacillus sp. S150]MBW4081767.1 hypothetical protein [Paenibacillus sp. S150]
MNRLKIYLLLILTMISLTSCSEKKSLPEQNAFEVSDSSNIKYEALLKSFLTGKYSSIDRFVILDLKNYLENHIFVQFSFMHNNQKYEGISYIYKYQNESQVILEEDSILDIQSEITKLMVVGELKNSDYKFKTISGIVNNKSIDTLLIKYSDKNNVFIKLNATKRSYLDVRTLPLNSQVSIENIIGLDENNNIIDKMQ